MKIWKEYNKKEKRNQLETQFQPGGFILFLVISAMEAKGKSNRK